MTAPCPFENCGKPALEETGLCAKHSEEVAQDFGLANAMPTREPRTSKRKPREDAPSNGSRGERRSLASTSPTISNSDLQKRLELLDRFGVRSFSDGILTIERDPSAGRNRKPVKPDPDEQPLVPDL